jgi:hypothetical protein
MIKKLLIGGLLAIVVIAAGVSAYNVFASQTSARNQVAQADVPAGQAQANQALGQGGANNQGVQGGQGQQSTRSSYAQGGQGGQRRGGGNGGGGNGQGGQGRVAGNGQGGQGRGAGNGGGGGRGQGAQGQQGGGSGVPNPQNGLTEWVTISGVVSNLAVPDLTLVTDDGQTIVVQLGSASYLSSIGLSLSEGDAVTLNGFYETGGSLAVGSITIDATGQTFTLRDELGRPTWRGGNQG